MDEIIKKFIVDNQNRKIGVQIDIDTFEKIENLLEDYGLYELMDDNIESENLDLDNAKKIYKNIEKQN